MNKAWKLEVKEVHTSNGVEDFVKIDKRQEWLVKSSGWQGRPPWGLVKDETLR